MIDIDNIDNVLFWEAYRLRRVRRLANRNGDRSAAEAAGRSLDTIRQLVLELGVPVTTHSVAV